MAPHESERFYGDKANQLEPTRHQDEQLKAGRKLTDRNSGCT